MNRVRIFAAALILLTANSTWAKPWRGIVPLHSTRADVRRLLGKPNRASDMFDGYNLPRYTVQVLYATKDVFNPTDDCDCPLRYWWGYYHAAPGTVLSVSVRFDDEISLAKVKGLKLKRLTKGEPDSTFSVDYFDVIRGVQYGIRDQKIHTIEYGPSSVTDVGLRCAPDPEADYRETRTRQICNGLFGPMIDRRMGLYEVNPFYVLSLTFDRHGELISLHVEPKYYYDWIRIDWEGRAELPHLSKVDYESLLSQIDHIKPRGALVQSVTTNSSGWREQTYRDAVIEWDEVGNPSTQDASRLVRWFTVFYVKRRAT